MLVASMHGMDVTCGGGGDEVVEGCVGDVPGDAPALDADPGAEILLPLGRQHLYLGQLCCAGMLLHQSMHRVLEQLEENVVDLRGGVGQRRFPFLSLKVIILIW